MNPRKLLALALVLVLAVISTGVFAYAQNAEGEPTPSETAVLTESNTPEPSGNQDISNTVIPEQTAVAEQSDAPEYSPLPAGTPTGEPTAEATAEPTEEPSVEATAEPAQTEQPAVSPDSTPEPTEVLPEPAVTETPEPTETVAGTEPGTESTETPELTFYDQLINAANCQSIFELINDNTEQALNLSAEQLAALQTQVEGMEDDGYKTDVLETLEYLLNVAEMGGVMLYAGWPGGGSYPLSMNHYKPDSAVYYMVVTSTPSVYPKQEAISSVTLDGTAVKHHASTSGWSGGTQLSTYYPGLKTGGADTSKTLSITPAEGYYVTRVVVACCGMGSESPFRCNTWAADNAYEQAFGVTNQGTVTTALPSRAFGHASDSPTYFILISVAPIPTPLYVEYDYGEIATLLGDKYTDSVFANADAWTDDSDSNVYKPSGDGSDGGVQTNDTQFKYTYSATGSDAEKAAAVQSWKHTTNTITAEAKAAAAEVGYQFAGWEYTYYTNVNATQNGGGSYNNYTYTFANVYGSGTVGENVGLTLTTNVRLVAKWEKIPAEEIQPDPAFLLVTKTFIGIDEIPENFSISVGGSTYTAAQATERSTDNNGNIVLKWKISVSSSATYKLKENGAEIVDYNLEAVPSGILNAEGADVSVEASRVTIVEKEALNSCSNTEFALTSDTVLIIAAKKNVIVLSAAPLGATARAAIIEKIKTFSGDFKHEDGNAVYFYRISQYTGRTISIGGTEVTISADGSKATIGATSEWTKAKKCSYGYEAAQNDISITNTYTPKTCTLEISKRVEGNIGDHSREFTFNVTLSGDGYSFNGVTYSIDGGESASVTGNTFSFSLKHGQTITVSGLPVGATFTVEEVESGYDTTVDGVAGTSKKLLLAETNPGIEFVNTKNITIETGVLLDSLPYMLILAVVIGVGVIVFIRKRHGRED